MIKISYLFWTLLLSILTSLLSYFYVREANLHGYPFAYFKLKEAAGTAGNQLIGQFAQDFNYLVFGLDLFFWWLIFSTLLVIVKNYVLD